jgi:hypothetical protein
MKTKGGHLTKQDLKFEPMQVWVNIPSKGRSFFTANHYSRLIIDEYAVSFIAPLCDLDTIAEVDDGDDTALCLSPQRPPFL